jgi:hypothetical protein
LTKVNITNLQIISDRLNQSLHLFNFRQHKQTKRCNANLLKLLVYRLLEIKSQRIRAIHSEVPKVICSRLNFTTNFHQVLQIPPVVKLDEYAMIPTGPLGRTV